MQSGVLDATLWDNVCQWLAPGRWFCQDTPVSSTKKTDCHDIAEILLKVTLNTIPPQKKPQTLAVISCYFQENVLFFRFIHRKDKDKHIIDNWWTQLSHIMWFVRLGNENNIIIFVPHHNHTLHPLDVSCFCAHNISIVSDIRVHNFTCNYKIWRWFARWGKRKQHYSICPPP
jgi:hypothetical protein